MPLVLVIIAGVVIIDVLIEAWRDLTHARDRRRQDRDRAAMLRALDRIESRP